MSRACCQVGIVGIKRRLPRVVMAGPEGKRVTRRDGIAGQRDLAGREVGEDGLVGVRGGRVRVGGAGRVGVGRAVKHVGLDRGRRPAIRHGRQAMAAIEGQSRRVDDGKGGRRRMFVGLGVGVGEG